MDIKEPGIEKASVSVDMQPRDITLISQALGAFAAYAPESASLNKLVDQFDELNQVVGHPPTEPTGRHYEEPQPNGPPILMPEGASKEYKDTLRRLVNRSRREQAINATRRRLPSNRDSFFIPAHNVPRSYL